MCTLNIRNFRINTRDIWPVIFCKLPSQPDRVCLLTLDLGIIVALDYTQ